MFFLALPIVLGLWDSWLSWRRSIGILQSQILPDMLTSKILHLAQSQGKLQSLPCFMEYFYNSLKVDSKSVLIFDMKNIPVCDDWVEVGD